MAGNLSSELQKLYAAAAARISRFGAQWKIPEDRVLETLARSVKSWGGLERGESAEDYLESLRAEDLALAISCLAGIAEAWQTFIEKYRPTLYAAARAICRDEMAAREIADSMWAELYGVDARGAQRRSLLDYFHGRSSLATWLRAIVAQRHIDSIRGSRRFEPLNDAESQDSTAESADPPEPGHSRMMEVFAAVLSAAIDTLSGKDRIRLGYYYRDELTLREIARVMDEHESTVSRKLDRTRRELRKQVEGELRRTHRMSGEQIQLCYDHAAEDSPFKLGMELMSQKKEGSSF
jgi:RNA polymerase sigma-70 factor (ECF subfamily)